MKHHSTSDFNFAYGQWSLSTISYVSAPTSLKLGASPNGDIQVAIAKNALTGVMEQGRIATWIRTHKGTVIQNNCIVFRNKSPDGGATTYPFYFVSILGNSARWYKCTAAQGFSVVGDFTGGFPPFLVSDEWRCVRVSWWNGYNPQNVPATVCRLEVNKDSVWYACNDLYDTNQVNKDQAIQRAGVGWIGNQTESYVLFDDTEFWLPV